MAKGKAAKSPQVESLLVELLTEELPPKALRRLSDVFAHALAEDLEQDNFLDHGSEVRAFATPRRLAALITCVRERARDTPIEFSGPSVKVGLDTDGKPTPALLGFARKQGVDVGALLRHQTPKGEVFVYRTLAKGGLLDTNLDLKVQAALEKLPVPKVMRWGSGETKFVRPVHGLMMIHGLRVVSGEVMGLKSSNRTFGHRFLSTGPISIKRASDYEKILKQKGKVVVSFERRRAQIENALIHAAKAKGVHAFWPQLGSKLDQIGVNSGMDRTIQVAHVILRTNADLLDEVTALVEWPRIYSGQFEREFLQVPPECISLTMQKNQKYFALINERAELVENYLLVSNMEIGDPTRIIEGNARVLRARLADARFFFEQDKRVPLAERVPQLASVIYHTKLGNQLERVQRIKDLANHVVSEVKRAAQTLEHRRRGSAFLPSLWLNSNLESQVQRAAHLCKADLLTEMVTEFPELQGYIGAHYAEHTEHSEVVAAIEGHYRPRFAGDEIGYLTPVSISVALADKLDTLAGLFGIGQVPTGDKDPFALRRATLGVIRLIIEHDIPIHLDKLVSAALAGFRNPLGSAQTDLESFIYDRLSGFLKTPGYSTLEVDSVVSLRPTQINLVPKQLEAVRAFNKLPEAQSLAAANKRVVNILKQAAAKGEAFTDIELDKLKEPAERTLFDALENASREATVLLEKGNFAGYLKTFAVLKAPVDAFFDSVMVMVEDPGMRQNRLALLADLRKQMNKIADISKLAVEK